MRTVNRIAIVAAVSFLTGCHSLFAPPKPARAQSVKAAPAASAATGDQSREAPAARVGQGVHGWPVLEREPKDGGWKTEVLWPLFSFQSDAEGKMAKTGLFLLFRREHTRARLRYELIPLLSFERRQNGVGFFAFPLVFVELEGRTDDNRAWRQEDVRVGPFGWRQEPDQRRLSLWPVFAHETGKSREELKFWPLYTSDRTTSPSLAKETDLLWPFLHWRSAPNEEQFQLRPVFFQGRHKNSKWTVVFPFVWSLHKPHDSFFLLWPFYGVHRKGAQRTDWVLYPFFARGVDPSRDLQEWDAFFPLFHYGQSPEATTVRALPLLWHTLKPGAQATVVFPFWWDLRDPDSSFQSLFPLFGVQRKGEDFKRTFAAGPFFISTRKGKERTLNLAWPIFQRKTDPEGWSFHVFPFLWAKDRKGQSSFHLWPLCGVSKSPGKKEAYALGPVFQCHADLEGWSFLGFPILWLERGQKGSATTVFPLFHDSRRPEGRSGWLLWPLAIWKDSDEAQVFRLFWKFIKKKDTAQTESFAVNPLFYRETNAAGDESWSALFGLISRTREGAKTHWQLLGIRLGA